MMKICENNDSPTVVVTSTTIYNYNLQSMLNDAGVLTSVIVVILTIVGD